MRSRTFTWADEKSAIFSDIARNVRVIVGADEGARLLRAFLSIQNPGLRATLVHLIEEIAANASDRRD